MKEKITEDKAIAAMKAIGFEGFALDVSAVTIQVIKAKFLDQLRVISRADQFPSRWKVLGFAKKTYELVCRDLNSANLFRIHKGDFVAFMHPDDTPAQHKLSLEIDREYVQLFVDGEVK